MKGFRDLEVWRKSHQLVLRVYAVTAAYPREEIYGLTSQLRRAPVSIPNNLSEGCGRDTDTDFARFVQIAMGSASETEYLLYLSRDLGWISEPVYAELSSAVVEVKRMLAGLLQRLRGAVVPGQAAPKPVPADS